MTTTKFRTINCIEENCSSDLLAYLNQTGFYVVQLDGSNVRDAETFFSEAVKVFPQDPPLEKFCNWDAFTDSLFGGLDELGEVRVAFVWTHVHQMLEYGLTDLLLAASAFEHLISLVSTTETGLSQPITLLIFLLGEGKNFKEFGYFPPQVPKRSQEHEI